MRKKIRYFLVITIYLLIAKISFAEKYEIISGQDSEVCNAYLDYVNSIKPKHPMVCGLEKGININLPKWTSLNIYKNINLLENFFKTSVKTYTQDQFNAEWNDFSSSIKSRIKANKLSLAVSIFDIDNDGKQEKVVKLNRFDCDQKLHVNFVYSPGEILQVIDDKNNIVPGYKKLTRQISYPFFYQNKTYFSNWSGGYKEDPKLLGKIYIFESFKPRDRFGFGQVCELNFVR